MLTCISDTGKLLPKQQQKNPQNLGQFTAHVDKLNANHYIHEIKITDSIQVYSLTKA